MNDDGQVMYARSDGTWVLRFQGAIRFSTAHAVESFLDALFARENPEAICVDLNDATSIDSTGVGVLAKIANGLGRAGKGKPVLFSANRDINELLTNLCMDEVCTIVPEAAQTLADVVIPATTPSERELARTVLEAHRLLSKLSEGNRATFQSVVDALTSELGES